jgi:hypothetical protein
MARTRQRHAVAGLADGRVLACGGDAGSEASAEVYDPAADAWVPTEPMRAVRYGHAAVALAGGRVLVFGGDATGAPTAELFDPGTGTWAVTSEMAHARYAQGAALLGNGRVLAVGGADPATGGALASCEIFEEPTPCVLNCVASATPDSGTAPLAVQFSGNATVSGCVGVARYSWEFGDGATSTLKSPSHTFGTAGTFAWKLTVTLNLASCWKNGTVTVTAGLPGDCDGDGSISIGEVQKAINMFLGLLPPECGVDCGGDGVVSIGEVQKVINGFLGLPSSC